MSILFFDTETTGLVDFKSGYDAEHQPHLLQLGAIISDEDGKEMCVVDTLVQVPILVAQEATAIHGITTDVANQYGVTAELACTIFFGLANQVDLIVAHNLSYDRMIMTSTFFRNKLIEHTHILDKKSVCTMLTSTKICKLPGKRGFKWPKLTEAHEILCGTGFENAHSAIADVRACKNIFFKLRELGHVGS